MIGAAFGGKFDDMQVVAVSQRVDRISGIGEARDAVDQQLARWIMHCGFLPVPVPNILTDEDEPGIPAPKSASGWLASWLDKVEPSAVVLSGGNDIGEFPSRDRTEALLLSWAREKGCAVLGLCRGMQMMAHHAGGRLVRVTNHVRTRHRLVSVFSQADRNEVDLKSFPEEVNSYHHWALDDCPEGFEVLARAPDGVMEAMRHGSLPWEGWMWHPEREAPFSLNDKKRLQFLIGRRANDGRHGRA